MPEVFFGVLGALLAYRALLVLGTEAMRAWVRHDRKRSMARQFARNHTASWSGSQSRPWRLMQRLGIEEARDA